MTSSWCHKICSVLTHMSTILPSLVKIGCKILELFCPQTHRLLNFPWFPRFRPGVYPRSIPRNRLRSLLSRFRGISLSSLAPLWYFHSHGLFFAFSTCRWWPGRKRGIKMFSHIWQNPDLRILVREQKFRVFDLGCTYVENTDKTIPWFPRFRPGLNLQLFYPSPSMYA